MKYYYIIIYVSVFIAVFSCSITRKVPDGSYLLKKNTVVIKGKKTSNERSIRDLSADEILSYIRQRPNSSNMFRISLALYSMSGKDSLRWLNRLLLKWGEPPVIFDRQYIAPSIANIKSYLQNRGFYHADVKDSVIYKKKKASVIYTINPNASYFIRNIEYNIADSVIKQYIMTDTARLRRGRRLSPNLLDRECDAIVAKLRNNGYYAFSKIFIKFHADSSIGNMQVDLKITINPFNRTDRQNEIMKTKHPVYKINNVYVYTNLNSLLAVMDTSYSKSFDTLKQGNMYVLYKNGMNLKPGVLLRAGMFEKGETYSDEKRNRIYNNLSGLELFKSIKINFNEIGNDSLDCIISLDPLSSQYYKLDFELSTNSSDMIGFSPGLFYGHRNLLKGAEVFNFNFRGVLQYSFRVAGRSSREFNVGASLDIPRFMMPVNISYFKTQLPHTQFNTSYIYQQRPDYSRAMANFRFGYKWKSSQTNTYMLNFPDFNMIKMYDLSPEFYANINNPYLKNMYSNHFIMAMTGSFVYNNQTEQLSRWRRDKHLYYRINGDIAGNFLSLFSPLMKRDPANFKTVAGMPYSQYVKTDINMIYDMPRGTASSAVYRFYFGIGKAYGNSLSVPFEKMFYAGGANSLRGWQVRGVGPGSVSSDSVGVFPNQVADLRIELNAERRFPLFWKFEGALFVDAGNIWSINTSDSREGARFRFSKFYKEINMNTGFGLRLNFGFFILRIDTGLKLYDAGKQEFDRIVLPDKWFTKNNYNIHFGINYPFND
ncbi:MAG: BamA/TamA family outer membrane protein [Prevotellaceae bacterium]|jgi:outer membrane protein assembly factor BamA|nr:BamA/TamA family outer membrane protein [Prevotellaceae bacterium]